MSDTLLPIWKEHKSGIAQPTNDMNESEDAMRWKSPKNSQQNIESQLAKEVAKLQTLEYQLVRGIVKRVATGGSLEGITEALVGDLTTLEVKSDLTKEQDFVRGTGLKQYRFLDDYIIKKKPMMSHK